MNKRQRKKAAKIAAVKAQRREDAIQAYRAKPVYNKHGVRFTQGEIMDMQSAVAQTNAMVEKQAENFTKRQSQLYTLGQGSDFILSRQHKDIHRFKDRDRFESYMKKQSAIHRGEYIADKARAYKMNFINDLKRTYGDEASDIAMKIRMMKPEEYIKLVAGNEKLEIGYVPSGMRVQGRLNELRAELGMKPKDEWFDETFEVTY